MVIFVTISFWVLISSMVKPDTLLKNSIISKTITAMLVVLIIAYIPVLNLFVQGDMSIYVNSFQALNSLSLLEAFNSSNREPMFTFMQWAISRVTNNNVVYVIFTFLLYVFILMKANSKIYLPWQRMYVFFIYAAYPFFYQYIFNGVRQGFAMVLILLAISLWFEKPNSFKFYMTILAAGLFHYTSFIVGISLILILVFNINLKKILILWSITAILFLFDLNRLILNFGFVNSLNYVETYADDNLVDYFGDVNSLNFLLFSAFFLFLSLFLYKKIQLEENKKNIYLVIIKCYIVFNTYFLLFGFIAYSNRLAIYSWFLIPIIISYPILHKKQHSSFLLFSLIALTCVMGLFFAPFVMYR